MLFNVHTNLWDDELLSCTATYPPALLPAVQPSSRRVRRSRARRCWATPFPSAAWRATSRARCSARPASRPGMAKNTYGTGCFMLMHTGGTFQSSRQRPASPPVPRQADCHTGVRAGRQRVHRRRGGAVAARRAACHPGQRRGAERWPQSVPDIGGVIVVPAFTGLGAPYWKPDARGAIVRPDPRHARWPTLRGPRWRASPSRAPRCCRP